MKTPPRKPSALQRKLAALVVTEPDISLAEAMRRVGYAETSVRHKSAAIARSPGVQQAMAEVKVACRDIIGKGARKAAEKMVALVDSPNDFASLQAAVRVLELAGVGSEAEREKVVVMVFEYMTQELKPVLQLIPEDRIPRAVELLREIDRRIHGSEPLEVEAETITEAGSRAELHA